MTTILMETTLDVVSKQRELVQEALGPDGAYARLKENLEMMYENSDIKAQDKAAAITTALTQFTSSVTNAAMQVGLQWVNDEKALALKREELQYQLSLINQQTLTSEEQAKGVKADKQLKQAQLIREYGIASLDSNGNVTGLDNSGKEYMSILNIQADTVNKAKQADVLDANKQQVWAQTHKVVADTYVNHGVYQWTTLAATGMNGVTKNDAGHVTLSDMQRVVASEQAKGYSYNAWANAASGSGGMIGTLVAAEIPNLDPSQYLNSWKTAIDKLNGITAPSISTSAMSI